MEQAIFLYTPCEGDIVSIKERFVDQFEGIKFLVINQEACNEDDDTKENEGDNSEAIDIPVSQFEGYLWIDGDECWYKVVDFNIVTEAGEFTYALQFVNDAVNAHLDDALDNAEELGAIGILLFPCNDDCDGDCNGDCSHCDGDCNGDCSHCDGDCNGDCSHCDGDCNGDCSHCDGDCNGDCNNCNADQWLQCARQMQQDNEP